jgi:subtilase family serine protease
MKAVEYVAQRHLANVISISDGTGESSYNHGVPEILAQDPGELAAAAAGIPLLVGTGDCGVVQNLPVANSQCEDTTTFPETAVWDDSPWVTAVGGSIPDVSRTGQRLGADTLWGTGLFGSGAGYSKVFARPAYQDAVNHDPMRSVPDLVMDSRRGTSESTPLLAGVLALATQLNGANVGPINPALYGVLGPRGGKAGIVDVTSGNNSVTLPDGKYVQGFSAGPGFDVASGWGTINAAVFVPSLVAATKAGKDEAAARQQAAADLLRLEHGIVVSGGLLRAGGFLPGHPVRLAVDGKAVTTLTASGDGTVSYRLRLSRGQHRIALSSMLITQSGTASGG